MLGHFEWRQRVGNEVANAITKQATTRGTNLHLLFEEYLANRDHTALDQWEIPLSQLMFRAAKPHLDSRFNNIYQQGKNSRCFISSYNRMEQQRPRSC